MPRTEVPRSGSGCPCGFQLPPSVIAHEYLVGRTPTTGPVPFVPQQRFDHAGGQAGAGRLPGCAAVAARPQACHRSRRTDLSGGPANDQQRADGDSRAARLRPRATRCARDRRWRTGRGRRPGRRDPRRHRARRHARAPRPPARATSCQSRHRRYGKSACRSRQGRPCHPRRRQRRTRRRDIIAAPRLPSRGRRCASAAGAYRCHREDGCGSCGWTATPARRR